jgi:hypothetical protein
VVAVTSPGPDDADVLAAGLDWLSGQYPLVFRTVIGVINQVPPAPRRRGLVAVFSPRGGVGKTTTALHLGHALAMVREHSVGDLLRDAEQLGCSSDLLPYLTRASTGGVGGQLLVRSFPCGTARHPLAVVCLARPQ